MRRKYIGVSITRDRDGAEEVLSELKDITKKLKDADRPGSCDQRSKKRAAYLPFRGQKSPMVCYLIGDSIFTFGVRVTRDKDGAEEAVDVARVEGYR